MYEGGEEERRDGWMEGGREGEMGSAERPSCCINLQIFSDDAKTLTLPPVPALPPFISTSLLSLLAALRPRCLALVGWETAATHSR